MKFTKRISFTALSIVLVASLVFADETRTEKYEFNVGGQPELSLDSLSGEITIQGWDKNVILINVTKYAKGKNAARIIEMIDVNVNQSGDNVDIETDFPSHKTLKKAGIEKGYSAWVNFDIKVPKTCELRNIKSVSGDIQVEDVIGRSEIITVSGDVDGRNLGGEVEINVTSGDIEIEGLHGESEITAVSGEIIVSGVTGSIEASTTSGDIRVEAIDLESAELSNTSGSIELFVASPLVNGTYKIQGMSSDVTVKIPESSSFELYGKTGSGDIESDYDFPVSKKIMKKTISGSHNNGNAKIKIVTFDGDIVIKK